MLFRSAVAELARDHGRLDAFRAAGMEAWWRRGEDLEDDAALRRLAGAAGLDPEAAVRAADDPAYLGRVDAIRAEAARRGVTGIPSFAFAGGPTVVGCQPYGILAAAAESADVARR